MSTPTQSNSELVEVPKGGLAIAPLSPGDRADIRLSLVVPTYNESKNLKEMVAQLTQLLDAALPDAYEIIIVDDNSPDRTWEIASAMAQQYPRLRVMRRELERGLSTAVIRGWQAGHGSLLAVIDGDLQHPPQVMAALLQEMEKGADVAVASRHVEGGGVTDWSLFRRFVSRAAQVLGLIVLPGVVGRVSDPMSGYFMVRRSAVQGIVLSPLGYKILIEVLGRGKARWIAEVPYQFRERNEGESKVSSKVYIDYIRHLLRLRLSLLPVDRFLQFALVGFSGVIVDMGLLFLLSDPSTLGWGLTRSKIIGAEVAILNNFIWNDFWTFRDIAQKQPGFSKRLRRFAKFQLICLAGLALNTVLLNLQFNFFHMNRYVANAVAIAIVTGWNFWLNLKLSWRATES